jgi:hypothetical protein
VSPHSFVCRTKGSNVPVSTAKVNVQINITQFNY